MAISLPDARQLPDDVLAALRLRALRGIQLGFRECDLAELLGVSRQAICHWWTAYQQGGVDAIPGDRTGRPQGSGRTLSDEQSRHLQGLIDDNTPGQLDIAAALWSRRAVRDLILKEYGIRMPIRTVGEYLKRWGYTAKRPVRHAKKQDPEEVRIWLEETYPALEKRALEEDAEIYWCDEAGVAADEYPRLGYAREGQPATMEVPDRHVRVNLISAISHEASVRVMTYKGTLDAALFLVFLERLLRATRRKIFLVVDRLRAHDCAKVDRWREEHEERIEVFYLPRYSPELNAEEYLNNDLKGSVNEAGLPDSREELRSRIQGFMRKLLHWPEHVMNYFLHPCVLYASGP